MLLRRLMWSSLLVLVLAVGAQAQTLVAVPPLVGHVTDQAGLLDAGQRQRLDAALANYEAKSGSQIAVLIVKTTEPEVIEQYSIRVADAWKLGRKGIDDGVLLVVAPDNPKALRRLRIEAGRGVQGVLTDAQSKRVLQDVIAPHFRQNDYYGGLAAGTSAIASLLDKEQFAPPKAKARGKPADDNMEGWVFIAFMIGAGLWMLSSIFGRGRSGNLSRSGWGSGATGFILGNVLSNIANSSHHGGFSGGSSGDSSGGFSGGGFDGGGGGMSGGGGSFDGGGASGDW